MAPVLESVRNRADLLTRKLPGWALVMLIIVLVPNFIRPPAMPADGLEPSWVLASEYAFQHHLKYGSEFIFTYGPFAFLTTRLFDPTTFPFVLLSDVFLALMYVFPLLVVRDVWLAIMYLISAFVGFYPPDAVVPAAALSLFGLSLVYRNVFSIATAGLFAFLALSKYSFFPVIVPLFIVSDLYHLASNRRIPVFAPTLLASSILLLAITSRWHVDLSSFLINTYDIIGYYSRSMQFYGNILKMIIYVGAAAIVVSAGFTTAFYSRADRPAKNYLLLAFAAGTIWYLFVIFKMGYVRQDDHILDSWHGLIFGYVVMFGVLGSTGILQSRSFTGPAGAIALLIGLIMCSSALEDMRLTVGSTRLAAVPAYISARVGDVGNGISSGFEWLDARRWSSAAAERRAADNKIKRSFPDTVIGTVDAVPGNVAPLILSGLRYRPRPVLESYSSYSPRLQKLDETFFNGPDAPDTLFLDISDIDNRLPMEATGPSLPVIGRWYDTVDLDPLGLVLRRRAEPRAMIKTDLGEAEMRLGDWTNLPDYGGGLLLATFDWPRSLFGRILAFAYREPILGITLKSDSGQEYTYRFVPSMSEAGVVLAPLPVGDSRIAALALLDPEAREGKIARIVAFRISGGRFARWTYPQVHVAFEKIAPATGFSGNDASLSLLTRLLDTASRSQVATGAVWVKGHDLFAHAPAMLSAEVKGPSGLRGSIGFADNPAVFKVSEGVRFIVSFEAQDHSRIELLDKTLLPKKGPGYGGPQPFSVEIPASGKLYLETKPVGNTAYDWSMWQGLNVVGQP